MNIRKGWLVTAAGVMAAMGGVPALTWTALQAFPSMRIPGWWTSVQFYFVLVGVIGAALLGWAAKGADDHSTTAQVQLSSLQHPQEQAAAVVEAKEEAKAVPSGAPIQQPVPIAVPKAPEVIKPTEGK